MALFIYKALQADGRALEGEVEAGGRQEALKLVTGRGLRPIRLTERGAMNGSAKPAKAPAKSKEPAKDGKAGSKPAPAAAIS